MGIWKRAANSTWKDTPDLPVNTGPTDSDRIKSLEDKWSAYAKQTRDYEERDRRAAGRQLVNYDQQMAQQAMMRSGGSINAGQDAYRRRDELFSQVSRPYTFDRAGGLTSAANAAGNAFKTGW